MIASQAMEDAVRFCEDMRDVSSKLLRLERSYTQLNLVSLIQTAVHRISREMNLKEDVVGLDFPETIPAYTNIPSPRSSSGTSFTIL